MSSFSFFKVPQLVQQLILGISEPCELITIALCSKRAHFLVRSSYSIKSANKQWRHSFVGGDQLSEVLVYTRSCKYKVFGILSEDAEEKKAEKRKIYDLKFQANAETHECQVALDENGNLDTIWKDVERGKRILPIFITELLNMEIDDAIVDGAGVAALKFLNDRQEKKIRQILCPVNFSGEGSSEEMISGPNLHSLLTDYPATLSLMIKAKTPDDFKCPEKLPSFNMLCLTHASWIFIEDIMRMDIEAITVGEAKISNLDLNRFLKHWLAGGSPKLKLLTVGPLTLDINTFNDLEQMTVFNDQPRQIQIMEHLMPYRLTRGFDITREDGRMVTLHYQGQNCSIIVWPKPKEE